MATTQRPASDQVSTPDADNYSSPPNQSGHDFALQFIMQLQGSHGELKQSHGELKHAIINHEIAIGKLTSANEKAIDKLEKAIEKALDRNSNDLEKACTRLENSHNEICQKVESHGKLINRAIAAGSTLVIIFGLLGFWAYNKFVDDVSERTIEKIDQRNKNTP